MSDHPQKPSTTHELLRHKNHKTTMVFRHVLNRGARKCEVRQIRFNTTSDAFYQAIRMLYDLHNILI